MHTYIHKVRYYETDKMGISHHSNYIRWMEEARVDFFDFLGWGVKRFEAEGVTSPVVSLECRYLSPTTFDDEVLIEVSLEKYTGVRFVFSYTMKNAQTMKPVFTAKSEHCFIGADGMPIPVKSSFPAFDAVLSQL